MSKNMSFYRAFDRNRPIKTIDGYDGTVYRVPFQICRCCLILINGLDEFYEMRYQNASFFRRWIVIRRS